MKYKHNTLSYIFNSLTLVFKPNFFIEMDCLSKTMCFCFLAFKTVKFISNRNSPILRLRFLRSYQPNFFSSQATVNDSSESIHIGDSSKSHILNEAKYTEPIPSKTTIESKSPSKKLQAQEKSSIKLQSYKSLKENEDEILVPSKGKVRPNYFVAVQITNPIIHEAIRKIQNHIATQNMSYTNCMTSLPSLHITLMVMSIPNKETHERALKALTNVYEEQNCMMCKNPLTLEFHGLGHFKNRVLYAKIKEDESLKRFCSLAENVRKCFTDAEIVSTDEREFNPHLTIAKIDFSKNKQKKLKKIYPSLYDDFINDYIGSETVLGIQLLNMTSPKNKDGYYVGDNLIFGRCTSNDHTG